MTSMAEQALLEKSQVVRWLHNGAVLIEANKEALTALDAAIGDADHGVNLARGFNAVAQKLPELSEQKLDALFKGVGMTLMSTVGGASGMLYAAFFLKASAASVGHQSLDGEQLVHVLQSGVAGIVERGRAQVGDKTMIDVWTPTVTVIAARVEAGDALAAALDAGAAAAKHALAATAPLQAKKGRASYLGPRSVGHVDPGAASAYLLVHALAAAASPDLALLVYV